MNQEQKTQDNGQQKRLDGFNDWMATVVKSSHFYKNEEMVMAYERIE